MNTWSYLKNLCFAFFCPSYTKLSLRQQILFLGRDNPRVIWEKKNQNQKKKKKKDGSIQMWSHHAQSQTMGFRKKTTENYNPFMSNF